MRVACPSAGSRQPGCFSLTGSPVVSEGTPVSRRHRSHEDLRLFFSDVVETYVIAAMLSGIMVGLYLAPSLDPNAQLNWISAVIFGLELVVLIGSLSAFVQLTRHYLRYRDTDALDEDIPDPIWLAKYRDVFAYWWNH